jgi:FkbM family methyltransferase
MRRPSRPIPVVRERPLLARLRRFVDRVRGPEIDEVAALHASLPKTGDGVLVDVGAHHGSSLERFARDGWWVYAFEPDAANRAVLRRRISNLSRVAVDDRAVAPRDGDTVDLYTSHVSTGISALAPFHKSHRPTALVTTVRLDTYLSRVHAVTVLKTDTEGYDLPVIRTFPWDRLHPRAVICEFEDRKTVLHGYTYRDLADYLVDRGYAVLLSEWYPVIEYGTRHRWRSIRPYPADLADPAAWGNLIGVEAELVPVVLRNTRRMPRTKMRLTRLWDGLRRQLQ